MEEERLQRRSRERNVSSGSVEPRGQQQMVVGAQEEEEEWEGEKAVPVSSLRIQSSAESRRRADFANTPYIKCLRK